MMISSNLKHCFAKSTFIESVCMQKLLHLSCISLDFRKNERDSETKGPAKKADRSFSISKLFTGSSDERNSKTVCKPPERKWISVNNVDKTNKKFTPFIVMSYNILSQFYVHLHRNLYANNDPADMQWEHRLNALKAEIYEMKPDILCLQEVQDSHLDEIKDKLKELDYDEPLYKKRNGSQVDGCAIFFNRNLFDLVECHYVEYYQPNIRVS